MVWAGHELPIMFKGAVQVNNTCRHQSHEDACEKVKIKHWKRLEQWNFELNENKAPQSTASAPPLPAPRTASYLRLSLVLLRGM